MICVRKSGIWHLIRQRTTLPPFSLPPYAKSANQDQRLGLQIEIKESKTPGGENNLDAPGVNFSKLGR
jgi:hypothetical protein